MSTQDPGDKSCDIFDIDTDVANANTVGGAAGLRMNKFERFVAVQSDSALRQVAGMYAYDNDGDDTHEVTLRKIRRISPLFWSRHWKDSPP